MLFRKLISFITQYASSQLLAGKRLQVNIFLNAKNQIGTAKMLVNLLVMQIVSSCLLMNILSQKIKIQPVNSFMIWARGFESGQ